MFYENDSKLETNYRKSLNESFRKASHVSFAIEKLVRSVYDKYSISISNELIDNTHSLRFFCDLGALPDYNFRLMCDGFYDRDGKVVNSIFLIRSEALEDLCNELKLLLTINGYHDFTIEKIYNANNEIDVKIKLLKYK